MNSLLISYAADEPRGRCAIVIGDDAERREGAEPVYREWLFILNAVADLQMLLFSFFEVACSCGDADLLLHGFFLAVGSVQTGDQTQAGSVLTREEYHVVREIELDFGQRKVGKGNFL